MIAYLVYFLILINAIHATDFGVGFSLSHDYAVASVVFANGRTWDVAHIAGSRAYEETISYAARIPDHAKSVSPNPPGEPIEIGCANPIMELYSNDPVDVGMGMQPLYDRLPPWLGGVRPDKATVAITEMLRALKVATESALQTQINQAHFTVPFPLWDPFKTRLRAASFSLGLEYAEPMEVAEAAIRAHGILRDEAELGGSRQTDELVLVLDHNKHALVATLAVANCTTISDRRILQLDEFAADELEDPVNLVEDPDIPADRDSYMNEEPDTQRSENHIALLGALRRLTAMPVKGFGDENLTQIDHIIFVGQRARHPKLEGALVEVFGRRYDHLIRTAFDYSGLRPADAMYLAAQYAARRSLNRTHPQPMFQTAARA